MKKWYVLLALFVVVLYLARSGAFSKRPDPGTLKPGNPVDVRIGRGALVVDGDPVDPLISVKIFRLGPVRTEIQLAAPFSTSTLALFFFEPEPGAAYEAEVATKHRQEMIPLQAMKDPPAAEILRMPLNDPSGTAADPDRIWFNEPEDQVVVSFKDSLTVAYSLQDGSSKTVEPLLEAPATRAVSKSGRFIAILQPPSPNEKDGSSTWQIIVLH